MSPKQPRQTSPETIVSSERPVPIEELILLFRGQSVMLDADLAALYGVETKHLVEAVKRNTERFPPHFMLQLTKKEFGNLRSQSATSSWGGRRYPPLRLHRAGRGHALRCSPQ